MSENIAHWLRLARTRRMFARALGGGERPNETYLAMATTALDAVATEWARVPWAEAEALPSVERLARALHAAFDHDSQPAMCLPNDRRTAAAILASVTEPEAEQWRGADGGERE